MRSPSRARTADSEASKNPCSKPSWTIIKRAANAIPALDRSRRRLLATRFRQASGTPRLPGEGRKISSAATSEHVGRVGAAQIAERQKRRGRGHQERDDQHREEM